MQDYTFTAKVEDGRLKVNLRALETMRGALKGWRACPVTVTIEKRHAIRSGQANKYYWSVVIGLVSEHTGYTPEETHDVFKSMFLPKRLAMIGQNGELLNELIIGGSTTRLNSIEFYEYVERVREFAREKLGVIIPNPNDVAA